MSTDRIRDAIAVLDLPPYRAKQISEWLYRRALPEQGGGANARFATMSDLPAALRERLADSFEIQPLTLRREARDRRDGTIKIVAATHDGLEIESVLMPDVRRVSVCLSTQAGCPMACSFCATGTQGLARNLSAAEIVGQFLILQTLSARRITHAVYMGMGEPLLNLDAVLDSIQVLHDEIGLSMRHITVSTVGIIPGIRKLAEQDLSINLAISLHAPSDELRRKIVPGHKSLADLIDAARDYFRKTGREITFEYVLLKGVNDNPDDARRLAEIARRFPSCTVNLIPYNVTTVAERFDRPDADRAKRFRAMLEEARIRVTQRKERGRDIAAACGQLVTQPYRPSRTSRAEPAPIEDDRGAPS
jgi:23S rRNA (adenine2503-C2)-methyltransferase